MKLPKFVKVGHRTYKIVEWTPSQAASVQRYGEMSSVEQVIRIDLSHGIQKARDTLLHEILHACWYEWGIQDEDKEERTVATTSTSLTTVMTENKPVRDWFAKAWAK